MKMDRYPCVGTLRVSVDDENQHTIKIWLKHGIAHQAYTDISLPAEVAKIIEDMKSLPPSQVRAHEGLFESVLILRQRSGLES
jgi:hypothetical protein